MKKKKDINYLELTPYRKHEHEIKEDGNVNVLVPRYTDFILGKLLQPRLKNKFIRANLDEFGTATWLTIDSNTKVSDIAIKLENKYGAEIQPVIPRLTTYLTQLYNAGFISFSELKKK